MESYRASHVGEGTGVNYDASLSVKVDGIVWESFVQPHLREVFRDIAASGATRYLDFACGTGRILSVGSEFFESATGIDISPDMLTVARERVPRAELHCLDVTRTPLEISENFDCVSLFRFILNAEPSLRQDVLMWLAKHMQPGATLVGNIHMVSASISGLMTLAAEAMTPGRRNVLSIRAAEELLRGAGFRVERWTGFRVLPSIMGRPPLGRALYVAAERLAQRAGLGRIGSDHVFIARRV